MGTDHEVPPPLPADTRVVTAGPAREGSRRLEGRTIGSYTLLSLLGQGGMGSVFLAEHVTIGRKAAIKILDPDIASDPEAVSRFFTEARAVNDIRHPNIVEVTDFGQFDALYCIVMEYLEGETLAARLTRIRRFDEATVVRIMKQCLSALGAAHERGLVHRDIKPENIFLRAHPDYPDFVKLLDFGIAKLLASNSVVGHHTKTGSVLGTPAYMSPEQCLGESALDIRSDIYSLGVVIYQMLTGRVPFSGDTLGRLIVCHVSENAIPPSVLNPLVSRAMNDLVMRALQKKPKDRHQNARELRDSLERVLAPQQRTSTPIFGVNVPGSMSLANLDRGLASGAVAGQVNDARSGPAVPRPAVTRATAPGRPVPGAPAEAILGSVGSGPIAGAAAARPGTDLSRQMLTIVQERVATGQLEIPKLSVATRRCIELAHAGRLGFADAAEILGGDAALRSRIMRLANSAAFPSLMPATNLSLAVARLGTQGLFNALIEFAARDALEGDQPRVRELMRRVWPHALGTAGMTVNLHQRIDGLRSSGEVQANAYLAGLMAATGKPVIGHLLLDIERQLERAGHRRALSDATLQSIMDAAHSGAGAAVCRQWELPREVAVAVDGQGTWNAAQPDSLSNLVRFATAWTSRLGLTVGNCNGPEVDRAFGEGRALLRIDESTVKALSYGFKERVTVLSQIRG